MMPGGIQSEGDPYGPEALTFVKEMVMQREVEMEIEGMDKGGNFIGYMFLDNTNVSVALVEEGLASGFMTDRSQYGRFIQIAEDHAKLKKEKIWKNYVEAAPVEKEVLTYVIYKSR